MALRFERVLRGTTVEKLEQLVGLEWAGSFLHGSPFKRKAQSFAVSPSDERCLAGAVTITPDSTGRMVEISGELFTLRDVRR